MYQQSLLSIDDFPVPSMFRSDEALGSVLLNNAWDAATGFAAGARMDVAALLDRVHPGCRTVVSAVLTDKAPAFSGAHVLLRDASQQWAEYWMSARRLAHGLVVCFSGAANPHAGPNAVDAGADVSTRVIEMLPLGVIVIDSCRAGVVTFCNRTFEKYFAIRRDKITGRKFEAGFAADALAPLRSLLGQACAKSERGVVEQMEVVGQGGVRRFVKIVVDVVPEGGDCGLIVTVGDVSDRVRIQEEQARIAEALACREENYRMLADNSSDLITRHGFDGIILFASNASLSMLGVPPDDLVGHCLDEYVVADDRLMYRDFITVQRGDGEVASITCRMKGAEGVIWVEVRATARKGKRGGVELTCVSRDVSERKRAEDRMRDLQTQLSSAIENMDAGIVMYDKDDRLVFCNNHYRYFYPEIAHIIVPGMPYRDIIDAFIKRGVADESGLSAEQMRELRVREHKERTGRVRIQHLPGNLWVNVSDHPTGDGGVVCLMTDITALKNTKDELARQRLMLVSLLDSIPDPIFYKDAAGAYIACNPAFCALAGLERDQIIGRRDSEVFDQVRATAFAREDARAIVEKSTQRNEEWVNHPDGRRVHYDTLRVPIISPEGKVLGIVGISRDSTDSQIAEAKLRAESLRLSTLIRNVDGGVIVMDQHKRIILVNDGFLSLFRVSVEAAQMIGRDCTQMGPCSGMPECDKQTVCSLIQTTFDMGLQQRDSVLSLSGGVFIEYDFISMDIARGEKNYLWHFRDISARRRSELELQRRDTLLSGLATTVRQLLGGLEDFDKNIREAFRIMAESADINRIFVMQNRYDAAGECDAAILRFIWSRSGDGSMKEGEYSKLDYEPVFSRWLCELSRGVIISDKVADLPDSERLMLSVRGFGSILVAPMFIEGSYWGLMLFDAPADHEWGTSDRGILRMVADSIGLAIQRKAVHDQLNSALEHSKAMAEQARRANNAETDFLASMSHEIRTPLNGVVGYCNLLRNTQMTSRQNELLRGIDRSTEILLSLINDILDLSKITAGQLTLDSVAYCPAIACEDAVAALSPKAAEKGLALTCEADAECRQLFVGDERRLKQVLLNLLSNAIKFTESGFVHLRAWTGGGEACAGDQTRLFFSVADSGIGISAENQTKLFRPFSQAEDNIGRRFGGTGLGLAICKRIVEMMGGRIDVVSVPGKGSVFSFSICCEKAEGLPFTYEANPERPGRTTQALRELGIVVADDNVINQEVLSLYLEELGYSPRLVDDGAEALEAVKAGGVDLVLMDIRMPGMDGIEATQAIREWEKTNLPEGRHPVRIVALTADAVKGDSERCLAIGMDDYLTKPVDPDQIDNVIHRLFAGR